MKDTTPPIKTPQEKKVKQKRNPKQHTELKNKAIKWLRGEGFTDIEAEVRIVNYLTGNNWRGSFVVDVIGRKENLKVAIECGGSRIEKLNNIRDEFNKVYILPYGQEIPFEWNYDINICLTCGHKV